ncbi:hypothetical protein GGQ85_003988 [Nitrobacter vulgaris]|uniref:Uncharacterized protein n=2 Tax=Nitrobacter vulgaris TaxID=29421 RepID=A0A1V4I2D4_NITVU|nr:hypothetical protein [Nitrobacter vulgaris]MDR6306259.1 hypothetical protein [Nitrobacter vulgaris]OPH84391.1 hypothetical protein B2M20_02575 [Nitrobacter vulgaris]
MQQVSNDNAGTHSETVATAPPRKNADVLAKVLLDIKLMLDIEKVLAEELTLEMPLRRRPVHDQILKIIEEAHTVSAAEGIQAGFRNRQRLK